MEVHKCAPLNLWKMYPLEEISAHCGHGYLFRVTLQDAQRHLLFHATAGSLPPSPIPIIQSRPKTTPPVVGGSYALVWTQAQVNFQLNILPHYIRLVPTCTEGVDRICTREDQPCLYLYLARVGKPIGTMAPSMRALRVSSAVFSPSSTKPLPPLTRIPECCWVCFEQPLAESWDCLTLPRSTWIGGQKFIRVPTPCAWLSALGRGFHSPSPVGRP